MNKNLKNMKKLEKLQKMKKYKNIYKQQQQNALYVLL